MVTVLSVDGENNPDMLAILGASAALMISPIPFTTPIGAVRVGRVNNAWVVNPTYTQLEESSLDLIVAATKDNVMMFNRIDVFDLAFGLRRDKASFNRNINLFLGQTFKIKTLFRLGQTQGIDHIVLFNFLGAFEEAEKIIKQLHGLLDLFFLADDLQAAFDAADADRHFLLNRTQVLVVLTKKLLKSIKVMAMTLLKFISKAMIISLASIFL